MQSENFKQLNKMQEEKKVVNREVFEGLQKLITSSDKDNQIVAISIIEECDHTQSLPWLLILFKMMNENQRKILYENAPNLKIYLNNILTLETISNTFSTVHCYNILQKKCRHIEEPCKYLIEEEFAKKLVNILKEWGCTFMNDYTLTITRNDNTRQK